MSLQPEAILENACIGVMGVDRQGTVHYINPRAGKLLDGEISLGSQLTLTDPTMGEQILACMEGGSGTYRFHIKRENGDMEIMVSAVCRGNDAGTAVCFLQSLDAVEASAWELPNIKDMHLQFQTLLDHSYYGIYIMDGQGRVLKVNEVAAGLIGMERDEMIGMDIRKLAEDGIVDQALTPAVLESKKPQTRPLYHFKSNRYIMASGVPIFDEKGEILFVVVIEHDMTIVKELRDQLKQAKQVADTIKSELSDRNLLELKNSEIIADAPAMNQVLTVLLKLSKMDASNILITGESGTGKGFLSKFVHQNGTRKDKPFISINCAALPDMLLEAELFGYEKGAFTGASDSGKAGLFELANQGTIFLDEIGDLPFSVQAKLLKCLDEGEIRRLGGTKAIKVNCIVIAATNHNLEELVEEKKFRQDLYFRLNIFPVHIPALRERREDILQISNFYLKKYNEKYKQKKRFSESCIEELLNYDFPGNVRELKNLIKNAVVIREKNVLDRILPANKIPVKVTLENPQQAIINGENDASSIQGLNEALDAFEKKQLEKALTKVDSTRDLAAYLDISQSTAVRKLKKHGLSVD